ncbi:MAG: right-handed parallel beta-helix repeat-containing protein [Promethearchaeota archaeon]|jgi:parallel beta-helix repeat protein
MKSHNNHKIIILIILGILFTFSPSSINNSNLDIINQNLLNKKDLKISPVSGIIHINNNWTAAKSAGIVTGNGTYSEPYIIEDLVINTFPESGILIENSNAYLIIENCSIGHAAQPNAGIELVNVNNSQIINNDCSLNYHGIYLRYCNNNTISGNIASDTDSFGYTLAYGILLEYCHNNIISGNTANYSGDGGIHLRSCDNNIVSGNIVNDGDDFAILLSNCKNNFVSGNTANDVGTPPWNVGLSTNDGIGIVGSVNNIVTDNIINNNGRVGISLVDSHENTISRNTVNSNQYGIWLRWDNSYNVVSENVISGNSHHGIFITDQSNHNSITGNILSGNGICIEEVNCFGNLYWKNSLCIYIGAPYFEILIYGSIIVGLIIVVVFLEIKRRKSFQSRTVNALKL